MLWFSASNSLWAEALEVEGLCGEKAGFRFVVPETGDEDAGEEGGEREEGEYGGEDFGR